MEPGSPREMGDSAPAEQRKQILVVEDELLIRILVCDALREEGYEVIEACNAEEALTIFDAGLAIDLIVSDVRMPGSLDGLDLLGVVRRRFVALPVLLTSGHLEPDEVPIESATHFLRKPYRLAEVLKLVAAELARIE